MPALMRRRPWTISLICPAGMSTALASWDWLTLGGSRKLGQQDLAGCTGGMIVSVTIGSS